MKVRIPVIIEDQLTQFKKGIASPTENITIEDEFFLDGPISNRVAILDFDENGQLRKGARFFPGETRGNYEQLDAANNIDLRSDPFIQVNTFGVVYRTLSMFEEADTMGRQIHWAFNAPQLLVVPRAGRWANAFYQRDSHSLQFFYFPSNRLNGDPIFTSLSHDIIAHETAHAILDGIAPDLYHAITPQSLALHEAIADLTALIMSFRSRPLRETVLLQTGGSISDTTAFSSIATEFGANQSGFLRPLRNLKNDKELPRRGAVRTSPHELSEILSGALYEVMIRLFDRRLRERMEVHGQSRFQASGFALFTASEQFKRMIFRALDYLPPGEISFADYGRAIIAADRASHPEGEEERQWISEEFVRRKIVPDHTILLKEDLSAENRSALEEALAGINLKTLIKSDWAAYDFGNRFRRALKIPNRTAFEVRPRLDITKKFFHRDGNEELVRECIFKIAWNKREKNRRAGRLPSYRVVTFGSTLVIDWQTKKIRSFLTTDKSATQRTDRNNMLIRLQDEESLSLGHEAFSLEGIPRKSTVVASVSNDSLKLSNTAHLLHVSPNH